MDLTDLLWCSRANLLDTGLTQKSQLSLLLWETHVMHLNADGNASGERANIHYTTQLLEASSGQWKSWRRSWSSLFQPPSNQWCNDLSAALSWLFIWRNHSHTSIPALEELQPSYSACISHNHPPNLANTRLCILFHTEDRFSLFYI